MYAQATTIEGAFNLSAIFARIEEMRKVAAEQDRVAAEAADAAFEEARLAQEAMGRSLTRREFDREQKVRLFSA